MDTAASLEQTSEDLATLATALSTRAEVLGGMVSTARTELGNARDEWGGPSADAVIGTGEDYLDLVEPAVGALESAHGTVSRWAMSASDYASQLRSAEQWLDSIEYEVSIGQETPDLADDLTSANGRIAAIRSSWITSCTRFAGELNEAITTLFDCNAVLVEISDPAVWDNGSYAIAIAQLSVATGVDISVIDRSGALNGAIAEQAAFFGSEDGAWLFAIIETAHQGDLAEADGNFSEDDIIAACDPETVRALLLQSGVEFDEGELDVLVSQVVSTAWMMRASEDEVWEDIDDDIEWYERGVFQFVREEVFAPVAAFTVGAACIGVATAGAPATGGVSLGAAGYCGGLTAATYSAANTWAHGGDGGDVVDAFTDPQTWVIGAGTGIIFQGATNFLLRTPMPATARPPGPTTPLPRGPLPGGLTEIQPSVYQSPGGLVMGQGSQQGHRLTHLLEHARPDPSKTIHTVFRTNARTLPELTDEVVSMVDEAWLNRGLPVPGDPGKFVVPMGRVVGTNGETSITIVVKPGTSEIRTAFPS